MTSDPRLASAAGEALGDAVDAHDTAGVVQVAVPAKGAWSKRGPPGTRTRNSALKRRLLCH